MATTDMLKTTRTKSRAWLIASGLAVHTTAAAGCTGAGLPLGGGSSGGGSEGGTPAEPATLSLTETGQSLSRVTSDPAAEGLPTLSPDRKTLLLTAQADEVVNGQLTGNRQSVVIGVAPSTGGRRTVYTSNRFFSSSQAWLPGGDAFVFVSNQMGKTSVVKAPSSSPNSAISMVVNGDMAEGVDYPKVSPDGARVCFQSKVRGRDMVGLVGLDGSNFTMLTEGSYPSFGPDGKTVLFQREIAGYRQVLTVDAATGGGLVQLTSDQVSHEWPAWSPDGQYILFSSNLGWERYGGDASAATTSNLFAILADGTGLTQLTAGTHMAIQPHWGSDGWVYFASNEGGNWDIWRFQPELAAATAAR
jgi:TolB protein